MSENIIERKEGEHFLRYFDRLLKIRESKEIEIEKSEIYELVFGQPLSGTESRKRIYLWEAILKKAKEENSSIDEIVKIVDEISNSDVKNEIKNEIDKNTYKVISDEEDRIQVIDLGDKYHVYSKNRSVIIDKEKLKNIKLLYCDDNPLTINELCRKLDVPRRDFILVKNAFNITHDDIPYIDEELDDNNLDDLVGKTLERRKEKYFIKLQQAEIKQMKEELSKYRNQDYLVDKLIDSLNQIVINPVKYNIEIPKTVSNREALLDVMDVHGGIKVNNYWNKYSVSIMKDRFEFLTKETIKRCADNGVSILHVSGLGDYISGIIHESLRMEAEIDAIEQVKIVTESMAKMLIELSLVFEKVYFSDVVGNHGRLIPNKNSCTEGENLEYFVNWGLKNILSKYSNIIFEDNYIDGDIIVKRIAGVLIFEVHGDDDKFNKVAQDLTMMIEKPLEIHLGHLHHMKAEEIHGVEVFLGRSFSGVDAYAKDLRATSKAGQRLYIYENGQRLYISDIIFN